MAIITRKRPGMMLQSSPPPHPSSSPPIVVLSEDLMIEILPRVPVSDLLQLRCMCKLWKLLVSDQQFVKHYLHKSITDINNLASKALEDINAFESHVNYTEEDAQQHSLMKELDNMLVVVQSLKVSLATIKVDIQHISDRMKGLQSFLLIYLKTASSSVI